jgi:hypothetical protein
MRRILLLILVTTALCGSVAAQTQKPITKDHFFSSIRLGKRERMTAARYIELIKQVKVDFRLTDDDVKQLRAVGGYLGKQGLDDLISAIRANYYEPPKLRIPKVLPRVGKDGEPLTLITRLEVTSDLFKLTYIADLIASAGYKGQTSVMSVLIIKNSDESSYELNIGASPVTSGGKEVSQSLAPGDQFEFPSGVNAARVYVFAMSTVKIDIAYRPMPLESLSVPDWLETDEGKRYVNQMLADIDKLIDEARAVDLRDYKTAIRIYNEWVDKVSLGLGQVDIKMRRLEKRTSYKFDWDQSGATFQEIFSDQQRNKENLRSEINRAILSLELARSQLKVATSAYSFRQK